MHTESKMPRVALVVGAGDATARRLDPRVGLTPLDGEVLNFAASF